MKTGFDELEKAVSHINNLISEEHYQDAYQEYAKIDKDLTAGQYIFSEADETQREILAEYYASYAYFLFNASEYELFFEKFIKAQNYGYSAEKRRQFIYEAFVEPNISDFQENYRLNIDHIYIDKKIEFSELPFWLVTTGNENEFFLYNKEKDILEKRIILEINVFENETREFLDSDILLVSNGSWVDLQDNMERIGDFNKNLYLYENCLGRLLSYFQGAVFEAKILSKIFMFHHWDNLKSFFKMCNSYFPHNYRGDDVSERIYEEIKADVHNYRLAKENRFADSILLSICIPSYNRGLRAYENVLHCLSSEFDEEIEVVLSNNGTSNDTKEYYDKIEQMKDSRLVYFSFEENRGVALNICKVAELASGKFLLLLSDEDLIDLKKLRNLLSILREEKENLGIVRVCSDIQGGGAYIGYAKAGMDALRKFMLSSNYLSGNIYRRECLLKYGLIDFVKTNLDNETCLYYPHMIWETILCEYVDVLGLNLILINEGEAEKSELDSASIGAVVKNRMPYYATYEGRIGQHNGFLKIIKNMEICHDFDILRELYKRLCGKTLFLVRLSINFYYKETDIDSYCLMEMAYQKCIEYLDSIYFGKKNSNKYKYTEDKKEILQYYLHSKRQISEREK